MRTTLALIAAVSVCAGARVYGQSGATTPRVRDSATARTPFEDEIEEFEAADKIRPPQPGGIVFVGSSSIRLWPNLSADFPGVNVIQRGFGGSEMWQAVKYATRIVLPYRPKRIVLYEGDNDLAAGRSPEQILKDYRDFVALVHGALPNTKIAFVAIKPSGSRLTLVGQMRKANRLIREYASTDPKLVYIDTFTPMLGSDGSPRRDLYAADSLHLSARGYSIWRQLLAPFVYGR